MSFDDAKKGYTSPKRKYTYPSDIKFVWHIHYITPFIICKVHISKNARLGEHFFVLIQLILEPEVVCDHRDKFGIGRLTACILNGIPKVGIEGIHVTSVPCHLNGVADGTLYA